MTPEETRILTSLTEFCEDAAQGRLSAMPDVPPSVAPELRRLGTAFGELMTRLQGLRTLAIALGEGQLEVEGNRENRLLDPLKALQANLRHLTWQAQEVAAGNLDHQVDFLGDFSRAFNRMIESLREKRRTDREAMETSRLASLGQLAGGIAHEINTPLQSLRSNVSFLGESARELGDLAVDGHQLAERALSFPPLAEPATRLAARAVEVEPQYLRAESPRAETAALDGLQRISAVVRAVMSFTDVQAHEWTLVDFHALIDSVLMISESWWKGRAEIERVYAPDLPPVACRQAEMEDALLRLVSNAALAVVDPTTPSPQPGRIRIETRFDEVGFEIRVSDSGPGVPEALRPRIFDPFFTTRSVGKGMGLGLTVCRDIVVTRHGGALEVGDGALGGACFTVRLPRTRGTTD